VLQVSIQNRLT